MTKFIHSATNLGTILVGTDGLKMHCTVSIVGMSGLRSIGTHDIEYDFVNMTPRHEDGMQAFIHGALAKGQALADAYIAARESEPPEVLPQRKDFSKRTTIFACGRPAGADGAQQEFEVYVQDFCDPSLRRLTLATAVGTAQERHLVLSSTDLKGFLTAMVDLQATPFTVNFDDEEAA